MIISYYNFFSTAWKLLRDFFDFNNYEVIIVFKNSGIFTNIFFIEKQKLFP